MDGKIDISKFSDRIKDFITSKGIDADNSGAIEFKFDEKGKVSGELQELLSHTKDVDFPMMDEVSLSRGPKKVVDPDNPVQDDSSKVREAITEYFNKFPQVRGPIASRTFMKALENYMVTSQKVDSRFMDYKNSEDPIKQKLQPLTQNNSASLQESSDLESVLPDVANLVNGDRLETVPPLYPDNILNNIVDKIFENEQKLYTDVENDLREYKGWATRENYDRYVTPDKVLEKMGTTQDEFMASLNQSSSTEPKLQLLLDFVQAALSMKEEVYKEIKHSADKQLMEFNDGVINSYGELQDMVENGVNDTEVLQCGGQAYPGPHQISDFVVRQVFRDEVTTEYEKYKTTGINNTPEDPNTEYTRQNPKIRKVVPKDGEPYIEKSFKEDGQQVVEKYNFQGQRIE